MKESWISISWHIYFGFLSFYAFMKIMWGFKFSSSAWIWLQYTPGSTVKFLNFHSLWSGRTYVCIYYIYIYVWYVHDGPLRGCAGGHWEADMSTEVCVSHYIQVVPGRAGGGSFKRKKNYIARKGFAYRMCARWPAIAMSKLFFWVWTKLLPLHGCDVMCFGVMCLWFDLLSSDVASFEVICGTTPVLLCTTKNYNVLLQYYSNVLLCTTKYYNVLLQYYSNVLLCTTKYYNVLLQYYSSTTLYYKVLLQYYSVLQSSTPVLLCTTKY